jgi:hypothetical protein
MNGMVNGVNIYLTNEGTRQRTSWSFVSACLCFSQVCVWLFGRALLNYEEWNVSWVFVCHFLLFSRPLVILVCPLLRCVSCDLICLVIFFRVPCVIAFVGVECYCFPAMYIIGHESSVSFLHSDWTSTSVLMKPLIPGSSLLVSGSVW